MRVHFPRRPGDGVGWQGDVQTVLNAVVAREVAACLCAGDDVIRAQSVAGVWEGDGEHGCSAILQGANNAAERRYDRTVE